MSAPMKIEDEWVEKAARAIDDADFGYSLQLTRLVEGVSTYTLTFSDSDEVLEFEDQDEAYGIIATRKRETNSYAAISAVAPLIRAKALEEAWQPIETAPKDGTRLWLYWPDAAPDDRQTVGWWYEDIRGAWWMDHADTEPEDPTHWMPCPSPPALASNGEKL